MSLSGVSETENRRLPMIGVFGGTFDPIHNAHLQMATEIKQQLGMTRMLLMPSAAPPLKDEVTSAEHRLNMLELSLQDYPELETDLREFNRVGRSYTVDTLAELRKELGEQIAICWCVGTDATQSLPRWERWQQLTDHGHLLVVKRPGWPVSWHEQVKPWLQNRLVSQDALSASGSGGVAEIALSQLDISSTAIRQQVSCGESAELMVPPAVWHYIKTNGLYD